MHTAMNATNATNKKGEASFVTSSTGQIAFLLWKHIYPDRLTFLPDVACVYFDDDVNWAEVMNSYWMGEKIPVCELAECIVVAQRMLRECEIEREWFSEMKEAIGDLQEDYVFPVMV